MKAPARWLLFLSLLAALALPAAAQQPTPPAGGDPTFTQQADPALVK
jgi:hypothetical protein